MIKEYYCDFCGEECCGKIVLRDQAIVKEDGSDIMLCGNCFGHYVNGEFKKIKLKEYKDD